MSRKKVKQKKPRVKWFDVVQSSIFLFTEYQSWIGTEKRRIKSNNRLSYLFLRSFMGKWFIDYIRQLAAKGQLSLDADYIYRIAKTPWITDVEKD